MARAVETKRPNPCGLLVGKIQNIAGVCTGVVLIIAGSLASLRENSAQRKFRTGAEKAEGALDAAEKRASKAEAKLKKLEAEMPYLKGALESKERRASAAEKALDAADNA